MYNCILYSLAALTRYYSLFTEISEFEVQMAHENDSIHGTFHLMLNLTITGEFEDLETVYQDELPIEHDVLDCVSKLLQITVGWVMPKKRQNIKQDLERLHKSFPANLNVIANLISVYNSLLLVKKSSELYTKLLELTEGNFPQVNLRKFQALAERAYVLVGDVASQEKTDDTDKLRVAIDWFKMAIELGKPNGMTEDECFIWKFFLAKTRYRLENRYRFEENQTAERTNNFVQMLTEFAEIYETSEVSDLYSNLKALALAYLADAFSIKNATDKGKKVPKWDLPKPFTYNKTLQYCHTNPYKAYEEASVLSHSYKIKNRFARAFMNWGSEHLEKAFTVVSESIESTKAGKKKSNWFGYTTCFQIYCKQYLSSSKTAKKKYTNHQKRRESLQAAKNILRKALEYIDDCPYRSASTLLDIADIYYYLGVDSETEKKTDNTGETDLEKSLEYLMMARERVEGYKNPRTHARLAHCLWELGSWRPAIECMKLAIGMERPGFTKNFINLCKYVVKQSKDIAAKDIAAILEVGKKKYKDITRDQELKEYYLAKLEEIYSDKKRNFPSENSCQDYQEPPAKAKNNGYEHDFIILNADSDMEFSANLLHCLENHLPTPYRGRHSVLFDQVLC